MSDNPFDDEPPYETALQYVTKDGKTTTICSGDLVNFRHTWHCWYGQAESIPGKALVYSGHRDNALP